MSLQIHHVHFLYRPSPDFPASVLCACLRSTLKVTSFSRVDNPPADPCCPGDGVLQRLVLEKNLDVYEYLWLCHLSSQLLHRWRADRFLCPASCFLRLTPLSLQSHPQMGEVLCVYAGLEDHGCCLETDERGKRSEGYFL